MNKNFIRTFLALAVIGVMTSIASLILPYIGLAPDLVSAAGQISSAFAGIFGLAVAALALQSYVWSESYEKKLQDDIWDSIKELDYAFNCSAALNNNIADQAKSLGQNFVDTMSKHFVEKLSSDLDRALNGRILRYLHIVDNELATSLVHLRMALANSAATGYVMPSQFYITNNKVRPFLNGIRKSQITIEEK